MGQPHYKYIHSLQHTLLFLQEFSLPNLAQTANCDCEGEGKAFPFPHSCPKARFVNRYEHGYIWGSITNKIMRDQCNRLAWPCLNPAEPTSTKSISVAFYAGINIMRSIVYFTKAIFHYSSLLSKLKFSVGIKTWSSKSTRRGATMGPHIFPDMNKTFVWKLFYSLCSAYVWYNTLITLLQSLDQKIPLSSHSQIGFGIRAL